MIREVFSNVILRPILGIQQLFSFSVEFVVRKIAELPRSDSKRIVML